MSLYVFSQACTLQHNGASRCQLQRSPHAFAVAHKWHGEAFGRIGLQSKCAPAADRPGGFPPLPPRPAFPGECSSGTSTSRLSSRSSRRSARHAPPANTPPSARRPMPPSASAAAAPKSRWPRRPAAASACRRPAKRACAPARSPAATGRPSSTCNENARQGQTLHSHWQRKPHIPHATLPQLRGRASPKHKKLCPREQKAHAHQHL